MTAAETLMKGGPVKVLGGDAHSARVQVGQSLLILDQTPDSKCAGLPFACNWTITASHRDYGPYASVRFAPEHEQPGDSC